jgi:hypothetical protein
MWSGLPQNLDNVASSLITSEQVEHIFRRISTIVSLRLQVLNLL